MFAHQKCLFWYIIELRQCESEQVYEDGHYSHQMYGAVVAFYEQMSETEIRDGMRESLNVAPEVYTIFTIIIMILVIAC